MKLKFKIPRIIIAHPFLISVYPLLFFFNHNSSSTSLEVVLLPLFFYISGCFYTIFNFKKNSCRQIQIRNNN
jgi:hypothetical protein